MSYRVLILLIALLPNFAHSETQYIIDMLYVPLRAGPSRDFKVLKTLKSGEKVDVTGVKENGFLKIRYGKNLEGWLPEQYLDKKPIARTQLNKVTAELKKAQAQLAPLQKKLDNLEAKLKNTVAAKKALGQEHDKSQSSLAELKALSGNTLELHEENKQLKKKLSVLERNNQALTTKTSRLESDQHNEGIKLGVLAIIFGIAIGFILPMLKPRRRTTSGIRLR